MKTKPNKKGNDQTDPLLLSVVYVWMAWEVVKSESGILCSPGHSLPPSSSHHKPEGPGSRQESKAANLLHAGQMVPQSRLLTDHK